MKQAKWNLLRLKQQKKPLLLPELLQWLGMIIVIAIIYFIAARVGMSLAPVNSLSKITPVWPPAPFALATLLSLGYKAVGGIFLGELLVNISHLLQVTGSIFTALWVSIIKGLTSTTSLLLAAFLIRRSTGTSFPFYTAQNVFKFLLIVIICPILSASLGLICICLGGVSEWENFSSQWLTFWLGDGISLAVFTPTLLIWQPIRYFRVPKKRFVEAILLLLTLWGIGELAFGMGHPIEYLLLPVLVWAAFRFQEVGAIAASFIVTVNALLATIRGEGSFVRGSLTDSLLLLQSFMAVVTITTLVLAAVLSEVRRSQKELFIINEELESRVEERTAALQESNDNLLIEIVERKQVEIALRLSEAEKTQLIVSLEEKASTLANIVQQLKSTQAQLIQTEKMSSLGQLVAGVAHEINNPVNFIYANLQHVSEYTQGLLSVVHIYQQAYPESQPEIKQLLKKIDLDFIIEDLPKIVSSMELGTERIQEIVLSLRNFSRIDEVQKKFVNIHEGIESTLLILQHRLKARKNKPEIKIIKEYSNLPPVECNPGQINQVLMNLLCNAIDAIEESGMMNNHNNQNNQTIGNPHITIRTKVTNNSTDKETIDNWVIISIADSAQGMTEEVRGRLFDPFFTTKPVGKGTGLGLSICYQIVVDKHGGKLSCISSPGEGAEFIIEIPVKAKNY
jgi:two-component system, NtrC family, sensor kinase